MSEKGALRCVGVCHEAHDGMSGRAWSCPFPCMPSPALMNSPRRPQIHVLRSPNLQELPEFMAAKQPNLLYITGGVAGTRETLVGAPLAPLQLTAGPSGGFAIMARWWPVENWKASLHGQYGSGERLSGTAFLPTLCLAAADIAGPPWPGAMPLFLRALSGLNLFLVYIDAPGSEELGEGALLWGLLATTLLGSGPTHRAE
jgi:hypothetical protein